MANKYGNLKHGRHGTLTYSRWKSMRQRCSKNNPDKKKYYSDRGIEICPQWSDYSTFLNDMGECPSKEFTLDRIDNEVGYQPNNCRWVTKVQQNKNRPSHQRLLTHNGITKTATEWAIEVGIRPNLIYQRLRAGWSVEKILTQPTRKACNVC